MKAKEVLSLLKITRVTLCSYVKKGIIEATRLPSGMYDYSKESVYNLLSKNGSRKTVIYARVSKSEATLLEEQISFVSKHIEDNGFSVDKVYKDIGCDIDMNRPGLTSLISDSIAHNIGRIFLLSNSRLSSTSFSFFQSLFKDLGIEVYSIANQLLQPLKGRSLQTETISSIHDWLVDRQPACNRYAFLGTKQDVFQQGSCCSIGTCWLY